jgi:hypothetical protein
MHTMLYALMMEAMGLATFGAMGFLVSEILFPGLLSSHISVFEVFLAVFSLAIATVFLAKREGSLEGRSDILQKRSSILFIAIIAMLFVVVSVPKLSFGIFVFFAISTMISIAAILAVMSAGGGRQ